MGIEIWPPTITVRLTRVKASHPPSYGKTELTLFLDDSAYFERICTVLRDDDHVALLTIAKLCNQQTSDYYFDTPPHMLKIYRDCNVTHGIRTLFHRVRTFEWTLTSTLPTQTQAGFFFVSPWEEKSLDDITLDRCLDCNRLQLKARP